MAGNYLFRDYNTNDYLRMAREAADWIEGFEVDCGDGKCWIQAPDSDEDYSDYPMLTPKSLYGGSAGLGLFFTRMYQAFGEEKYLENAKAAASHIMATYEGRAFYDDILNSDCAVTDKLVHVKNMPGWKIGFYNGPAGGGYLALKLYEVTGEEVYKNYFLRVVDDIIAVSKKNDKGTYWSEQSDLCGDGGFVIFLVSAAEISGKKVYLETAKLFGDYLISRGALAPGGGTYWNIVDLTIIDFPKDVFWVNMAHGTSGVGWIFTILYKATGEQRFLDAAIEAAKYIEGIAVGDEEAVLIPYLDSLERGPSKEFYYLSWCHGPAGTAILFQSLYKITGDENYMNWAKRMSRGIIRAGAPEHFSRGYWPSQALCCGTPGILEHFVSMYRDTKDREFLDYAKRTAATVIGQSFVNDAGDMYGRQHLRRWYGNWWRTIPQNVHSYTGLYIGTAGNAWTLLSLAEVLKGENWVKTIEFSY